MLADIKNACTDNASSRPAFSVMLFMFDDAKMGIVFGTAKQKAEIFYFSASIGLE